MTVVVKFTVAPDELLDPSNDVHVHRGLVRGWRRWGTLVHDGAISRALRSGFASRQEVQKLWQEAWKAANEGGLRLVDCTADLSLGEEATPGDLSRLGSHVSLAIVRTPRSAKPEALEAGHGLASGCVCSSMREVEDCPPVKSAEAMQELDIKWDLPPRQVWQERFAGLALTAKNITIVDRFALERHTRRVSILAGSPDVEESASGLWNAIRFIAQDIQPTRRRRLSVFTADEVDGGASPSTLRESARLLIRRAREIRVDLSVYFHQRLHARWMRFDGAVCALDSGLEVLEPARKRKVYDYSVKTNPEAVASFRKNEENYRNEGKLLPPP